MNTHFPDFLPETQSPLIIEAMGQSAAGVRRGLWHKGHLYVCVCESQRARGRVCVCVVVYCYGGWSSQGSKVDAQSWSVPQADLTGLLLCCSSPPVISDSQVSLLRDQPASEPNGIVPGRDRWERSGFWFVPNIVWRTQSLGLWKGGMVVCTKRVKPVQEVEGMFCWIRCWRKTETVWTEASEESQSGAKNPNHIIETSIPSIKQCESIFITKERLQGCRKHSSLKRSFIENNSTSLLSTYIGRKCSICAD